MTEQPQVTKKFLAAGDIIARAVAGLGGFAAWSIDAAYPPEDSKQGHPRIGRLHVMYTLEDGTWVRVSYSGYKARELLALLDQHVLDSQMIEWATAYDDAPSDDEEKPHRIGPAGKQKLMAYRGRMWDIPGPLDSAKHPYDDCGMDEEIEAFSCSDVGSCCYYEKKNGVFEMVIG